MPVLNAVLNVIMAGAALVGAAVAVLGLKTWRSQLKGKTEWELARRLLREVYRLRAQFSRVRNPVMLGGEMQAAYEAAGLDPEGGAPTSDGRTNGLVYQRRWEGLQGTMADLDVEALEAEVLWGKDAQEALAPLRKCASELFAALHMYLRYSGKNPTWTPSHEKRQEIEAKVWEIRGDDDILSDQIDEAISRIEKFLRRHLEL